MQYIYTMEYYSAIKRNKIGSFVVMWMNLDSVIQSKEKRKERNKYCILTYIYGIQRYDTDEQNRNLQGRNTDTDKENGHTGVMGERKGGKNWKSSTDIYIYTLPCVKYTASGKLLQSTSCSAWCSVMTWSGEQLEGRLKREEIYAYVQLIHFIVQLRLIQHCKATIFQ